MFLPSFIGSVVGNFKRPIVVSGGTDVIPNAIDFTNQTLPNAFSCEPWVSTNVVQVTGIDTPITLLLIREAPVLGQPGASQYIDVGNLYYRKSSSSFSQTASGCNANGFLASPDFSSYTYLGAGSSAGTTFSISNNEYLAFVQEGRQSDSLTVTITIKNASSGNTVLDTFEVADGGGCYLTSAVVIYMGLSDTGPELTAMRALRSHYINNSGYKEILSEYTNISQQIISGIQIANAESTEYTYIYNTVITVMNHVNAEEWQQAHDVYMAMYTDLKQRYVN